MDRARIPGAGVRRRHALWRTECSDLFHGPGHLRHPARDARSCWAGTPDKVHRGATNWWAAASAARRMWRCSTRRRCSPTMTKRTGKGEADPQGEHDHPSRSAIRMSMDFTTACDENGYLTGHEGGGGYRHRRVRLLGRPGASESLYPCGRPLQLPEYRHRRHGRLHQQPACRRVPRLRRDPELLCHGV